MKVSINHRDRFQSGIIKRAIWKYFRFNMAAMERIDKPATPTRYISSRSINSSANLDRLRNGGRRPPVFIRILNMDGCPR